MMEEYCAAESSTDNDIFCFAYLNFDFIVMLCEEYDTIADICARLPDVSEQFLNLLFYLNRSCVCLNCHLFLC